MYTVAGRHLYTSEIQIPAVWPRETTDCPPFQASEKVRPGGWGFRNPLQVRPCTLALRHPWLRAFSEAPSTRPDPQPGCKPYEHYDRRKTETGAGRATADHRNPQPDIPGP